MPDQQLRDALLANYKDGQGTLSSGTVYADHTAFWPHYDANYADVLRTLGPAARILDVGSGPGTFVQWLRERGYDDVQGVDLSPGDVAHANERFGPGTVLLRDGTEHLAATPGEYDAIFMKAILEHVAKPDLLPLVRAAASGLAPGGTLIIEVPNMDWLLAGHERYLDLTHEVGFTRESLVSLLALEFSEVTVRGSVLAAPTRSQRLLRTPLIRLTRRLLYIVGEGASDTLFEHRSLIATAKEPRRR